MKKWRFEPAMRDGRPVDSIYAGRIDFRLRPEDEEAIESLPYCTVLAIENARRWRWKPAVPRANQREHAGSSP